MTNAVKKIVGKSIETKYRADYPLVGNAPLTSLEDYTGFSQAITGTAEIYSCIPLIQQGLTSAQRIGDTITPVKLRTTLNLVMALAQATAQIGAWDITAHIYLMRAKAVRDGMNYTAVPITNLLRDGAGSNMDFNGTTKRAEHPVDNDAYQVIKHKKIRMVRNYSATGTLTQTQQDHSAYHHVTFDIPMKKNLKYLNAGSQIPTNDFPFFVIGWVNNDTTGNSPGNSLQLYVQGLNQLWFKDA